MEKSDGSFSGLQRSDRIALRELRHAGRIPIMKFFLAILRRFFHRPERKPVKRILSPAAVCEGSTTRSCNCQDPRPFEVPGRSSRSFGWLCATLLETKQSGEDGCLETRFPQAPKLAFGIRCKARDREKSPMRSALGNRDTEIPPATGG